ncbi:SDR family NAD(P)-dependent oxidoreductase [Halorussus marinus]|uniref:SDR family NAD(P)-dependent oxidoreductase n=1 Tax=Halorussus marinus TaxID=2505976 RepID=UPI00106ED30F|nr:SDR family NAD(P)-dependent oxidoreductase [Halorussus marinus]
MRVVLITGAASGIGRATARAFREAGWRVYATDVDAEGLAGLPDCETFRLDVSDPEACRDGVERVVEAAGRLDCLVNNAGYAAPGPIEDVLEAAAVRQVDVVLHGPRRMARAALPHLRATGGTIVNVSSVVSRSAFPGLGAYSAAKFGLRGLTDALRMETDAVGVAAVEPAWVSSDFAAAARDRLPDPDDRTAEYAGTYAVLERGVGVGSERFAVTPERVAAEILRAATDADPRARYPVGPIARFVASARYFPDPIEDRLKLLFGRLSVGIGRLARWLSGRER